MALGVMNSSYLRMYGFFVKFEAGQECPVALDQSAFWDGGKWADCYLPSSGNKGALLSSRCF